MARRDTEQDQHEVDRRDCEYAQFVMDWITGRACECDPGFTADVCLLPSIFDARDDADAFDHARCRAYDRRTGRVPA